MNLRPTGTITDNVRELEAWRARRLAKNLDNKALDTAIEYLLEYRILVNRTEALQRRLAEHDGCSRFGLIDYELLK